jgi:xanthine/CO dehydrogenase XdhC/CoxF family maturation factor
MKHEIDRVIDAARAIMRDGGRGVAVTLLRTSGSTYRRAGAPRSSTNAASPADS